MAGAQGLSPDQGQTLGRGNCSGKGQGLVEHGSELDAKEFPEAQGDAGTGVWPRGNARRAASSFAAVRLPSPSSPSPTATAAGEPLIHRRQQILMCSSTQGGQQRVPEETLH